MTTAFRPGSAASPAVQPRRLSPSACTAAALLLAAAGWIGVAAASPTFWTVSTQADFLKGDVENLSIDSDGRILLGPTASLLGETAAPFLWRIVAAPDGTIWAGTGNEGHVLRRTPDGKVTTFFDAPELEVHALAAAPGGGLYVGTSPDGRIYHVAADGTSRTFFEPGAKYIWSIVVDPKGTVYAATGDEGIIFRIGPDGKGAPFYRTNTANAVSLALTPAGDVLAGTESPGRLFRIDPGGKGFVLLDSPYREIHAVRLASDGTIYAAAVNAMASAATDRATEPPPAATPPPVPTVSTEITAIAVVEGPLQGSPSQAAPRSARPAGRGAIYRVRPDGLWDLMWDSGEDAPFDLVVEPSGSLLVGTGTEGKIFRVVGEPARVTLLARAGARQVTALWRDPSGRILGAASNPGKLFALAPSPATRGTYDSDVRDAGTVASWGVIRWRAALNGGRVEVFTRSGNTATPDETWSAWSPAYTNADGQQIESPNARYIQWRAVLSSSSGAGPILTSVTTAYLPRNLRPEVTAITVHPAGTVFQRPFSTGEMEIAGFEDNTSDGRMPNQVPGSPPQPAPALGRRMYQKGLQTFVWRAEDANGDSLLFDVSYRREGDTTWRPLRRGLADSIFVWDTTSVPDGTYFVKITASDGPSNAPATALVGERESTAFDVDNTPPAIAAEPSRRAGDRTTLGFVVTDAQSPVLRVEYSLDASRWQVIYPKDGIPDSRREEFEIVLEAGVEARSVIIRATDAMQNVATAVAEIRR